MKYKLDKQYFAYDFSRAQLISSLAFTNNAREKK